MSQSCGRRFSVVLALAIVLTTAPVRFDDATATTGSSATAPAGRVRTIVKNASLHFPTGQRVGTPSGIENPELAPNFGFDANEVHVRRPASLLSFAAGGTEYLLSSIANLNDSGMADQVGVWAVTNTASISSGTPDLHLQRGLVNSEVYGVPPLSVQRPGPVPLRDCLVINCLDVLGPGARPSKNEAEGPLDSNDSRMQQVYYSGGIIYGALDTVMQVRGNLQAGVAWFAVRPGATADAGAVARQGYLGTAHSNLSFPALAVLPDGTGVLGFTLVGSSYHPSAAYSRFGVRGLGAVRIAAAGQAPQDGATEYNAYTPPGEAIRPRWGDYGAAVTGGSSVFTASEYTRSRCTFAQFQVDSTCGNTRTMLINWGTRISRVTPQP